MPKIMIIEDDPAIREELTLLLENEGYTTLVIKRFTDIPAQAAQEHPSLILLDIGLPGKDGFSWIVNTFSDNFFKVILPVLYRGLISQRGMYPVMVIPVHIIP